MRQQVVQHSFFFTLLIVTTLAFFGLLLDFIQPLFWAAVLATLFYRMREWYVRRLRGRESLGALATLLTVVVLLIIPTLLISTAVVNEATDLYNRVSSGDIDVEGLIDQVEGLIPVAGGQLERFGLSLDGVKDNVQSLAVTASQYVGTQALSIGQSLGRFTIMLFLMLYLMFFFLRDGERLIQGLIRVLPLGDENERRLLRKFAEVSRATLKGTVVVGVVQGSIGGLLFWVLGLNAPIFWGVVMTLLSFLPAIGSALVWGPAAIILIATGSVVKGVILIAVGTLVIGMVDNVLRPVLVGRDTQMPDYLILLATLGGITVFGISGFVVGPIIAAFFLAIWDMFVTTYGDEDARRVGLIAAAASTPADETTAEVDEAEPAPRNLPQETPAPPRRPAVVPDPFLDPDDTLKPPEAS
ncbi:MAG: AI-2E family transporter [Bacteroidota bacterium]